jgi:hypothetical protein
MALLCQIAALLVWSWARRTRAGSTTHQVTKALALVTVPFVAIVIWQAVFGPAPANPVPHTLLALGCIGLATGLSFGRGKRFRQSAITMALVGGAIPWVALFGHAMAILPFYAVPSAPHIGMSVPAALALITLAIGIMGLWPDHGFVALFSSRTEGGMMLRGLLPAALIFPLALGGIMERGARLGWFDHTFSLALNLGITSIIFVGLVLLIGLLLKRREAERRAAMAERDALLAQLQASVVELQKLQTNFVTVCAWTKRVLDEGKWVKFEEFLENRLHITTSHGISEDAASEELSALLDGGADG